MSHEHYLRSSRLPDPMRHELLDQMDRHANSSDSLRIDQRSNKRKDVRWPYRQNDIEVTLEHPAGGVSRLLLASRNLSAGGIAFLHGGFVYTRSRCRLSLLRLDGQPQLITGTVVNCRHVQGLLHEIGVKFERRIDPHQFVRTAITSGTDSTDEIDLGDLHGRVLVVDPNEADRSLIAFHLRTSSIDLLPVPSPGAALDTVKKQVVDIVMCELNLDPHDGVALIRTIRETRFRGPIVVVTAEPDHRRIAAAREAGAGFVLPKPFEAEDLHRLMIQLHRKIGAVLTQTLIYSTIDEDLGMDPLIGQYIEQVQRIGRRLERAINDDNLNEVRQLCLNLKGSAVGYGFPQVGGIAAEAVLALDAGRSIKHCGAQLRTLAMLCDRLRVRNRRNEGYSNNSGRSSR